MVSLKAHFDGRAIVPDEPVQLTAGQKLVVHVELAGNHPETSASALDWAIQNALHDPALPSDLSHQHDYYLYGTPKKED